MSKTRLNPAPIVPGCEVIGCIYCDDDPQNLGEDMLEVILPNGVLVYCGWYPEGDPNGSYRVDASREFEQLSRKTTKDPYAALAIVDEMVREFLPPSSPPNRTGGKG